LLSSSLFITPVTVLAVDLPTGGKVIVGSATINQSGTNQLLINQASQNAILEFDTFSIGKEGHVHFSNGSGSTLNRVVGGYQSQIDGRLSATGSLLLINPNGVIVGRDGSIDTGGSFLASTRDITNEDFLDGGDNTFFGDSDAAVINLGKVSSLGGDITLLAHKVVNDGTLEAVNGNVGLASGVEILLRDNDHADGRILVKAGKSGGSVTHSGAIKAASAELRAHSGHVYALAQNRKGTIQVTGAKKSGGRVFLTANGGKVVTNQKITAKRRLVNKTTQKTTYQGGDVFINADIVDVAGLIDVSGDLGGNIDIGAKTSITLDNATLDASGVGDGGRIRVGGEFRGGQGLQIDEVQNTDNLLITETSLLDASSEQGDGGTVIAWSDGDTTFKGDIDVSGYANGGFAEVSGHNLELGGSVYLGGLTGDNGTVLFDPAVYNVDATEVATLLTSLASGNVVIEADNEININAAIDASAQGNSNTLTFQDENGSDVIITTNADITMGANQDVIFDGAVVLGTDTTITANDVTFNSTVDGGFGLTVNADGTTTFNGEIGETTRLASLTTDAAGTTIFDVVGATDTIANFRFSGDVNINDNFESKGNNVTWNVGGNATFDGTLTATTDNIINVNGDLTFNGAASFKGLQTGGGGDVYINGGSVTATDFGAFFSNDVIIGADTTITAANNGIRLRRSINSAVDNTYTLTLNTPGETLFSGSTAATGAKLNSIITDAAGSTILSGNMALATNSLIINDAAKVRSDATLSNTGDITFNSTIDNDDVNNNGVTDIYSLTVNSGGSLLFGGAVGGTDPLASLTASANVIQNNAAITTNGGDITFTADDMVLNSTVNAAGGIVTLAELTAGQEIDLGTDTAGKLGLTDTELNRVTGGVVRVGSSDAGDITVSSRIELSDISTLSLITGNSITDGNTGIDLVVKNLALQAVSGIGSSTVLETDVETIAAYNSGSGSIHIVENGFRAGPNMTVTGGDLTVGTVDGVVGVKNDATSLFAGANSVSVETNNGDLTLDNDIVAARNNIFMVAQENRGGDKTLINNAAVTALNGDILAQANNMNLASGTIDAGTNRVTLSGQLAGTKIDLGGADAAGVLGLTDAEIDTVTAGILQIGSSSAGDINFSDTITPANVDVLSLETGGSITSSNVSSTDISVADLALRAGTGIDLSTRVSGLAFENADGIVEINNSVDLTIASIDGLTSSSNAGTATNAFGRSTDINNLTGNLTFAVDVHSAGSASYNADGQTINVNTGTTISSDDQLEILAATINLAGDLDAANGIIQGTASTIKVSNGAEIQDAVDVGTIGTDIDVAAGTFASFIADQKNQTISGVGNNTIVNTSSPAVTIAADGLTVENMLLQDAVAPLLSDDHGILLDGTSSPNLTGIVINNITFNNLQDGVRAEGVIGDGDTTSVDVTIKDSTMGTIAGRGIHFVDTLDAANILIGGATVADANFIDASDDAVFANDLINGTIFSITNNSTFYGGGDGVEFAGAISGGSNVIISGNQYIEGIGSSADEDNLGDGIVFRGPISGAQTSILIEDSIQIQGLDRGINFASASAAGGPATIDDASITISGNQVIRGNDLDGILFNADITNANITIGGATAADGNLLIDGEDEAIDIQNISGGSVTIANNGLVQGQTGNGIEIEGPVNNGANVNISQNGIEAAEDGIIFDGTVIDSTVAISQNDIVGDDEGIEFNELVRRSTVRIDTNDQVVGTNGQGILFDDLIRNSDITIGGATGALGNTLISGGDDAIEAQQIRNSRFNIANNETITGDDEAIDINGRVRNGSIVNIVGNTEIIGDDSAIKFSAQTRSGSEINIAGNELIDGQGDAGIVFEAAVRDSTVNIGATTSDLDIDGTSVGFGQNDEIIGAVDGIAAATIRDSSFNVADNGAITGGEDGIFIGNVRNSDVEISDNDFIFGGFIGSGIQFVGNVFEGSNVNILNNGFAAGLGAGIFFGDITDIGGTRIDDSNVEISENTGIGGVLGGIMFASELVNDADVLISDNDFTLGALFGIDFMSNIEDSDVEISDNGVIGALGNGIQIGSILNPGSTTIGRSNISILDNDTIVGLLGNGIHVTSIVNGATEILIGGNEDITGGQDGIRFENAIDSSFVEISDNTRIVGEENGITFADDISAEGTVSIIRNERIRGRNNDGILFDGEIDTTIVTISENERIIGDRDGIHFDEVISNSFVTIGEQPFRQLAGNGLIRGGQDGIDISEVVDTSLTIVGNSRIQGVDENGIEFDDDAQEAISGRSSVVIDQNRRINGGAQGNGIVVKSDIADNSTFDVTRNRQITGGLDGIAFEGDVKDDTNVVIDRNRRINGGAQNNGIVAQGDLSDNAAFEVTRNREITGGLNGIAFNGQIKDDTTLVIDRNGRASQNGSGYDGSDPVNDTFNVTRTVSGDTGAAIFFEDSISDNANVSISRNMLTNGNDGIVFNTISTSQVTKVHNNFIGQNEGAGIQLNGDVSTEIEIFQNYITENAKGGVLISGLPNIGSGNVQVNQNFIPGNGFDLGNGGFAIEHLGTGDINIEGNWWGTDLFVDINAMLVGAPVPTLILETGVDSNIELLLGATAFDPFAFQGGDLVEPTRPTSDNPITPTGSPDFTNVSCEIALDENDFDEEELIEDENRIEARCTEDGLEVSELSLLIRQ
jgi:filamentous hemagglutinin family protein